MYLKNCFEIVFKSLIFFSKYYDLISNHILIVRLSLSSNFLIDDKTNKSDNRIQIIVENYWKPIQKTFNV